MRELVIDNKVIEELNRAKSNHRLMHVYLFYGDDFLAMKDTAFLFATNFYCGCLNCPVCESILDDNHLNVKYVGIEEGKTLITKEQIEDVITSFSKTSLLPGPRIYIIDGIDTASQAAQNSLLKFIEDPAMQDEVYGVLIARNLDSVLPTIKSRCAELYFKSKTDKEVEEDLQKEYNQDEAFLLAALVRNKIEAREIYVSETYALAKDRFYQFIGLSNAKDAVIYYLHNMGIDREGLRMLLAFLLRFYNSALNRPKLISSVIYGKIREIQSDSRINISSRLRILLDLERKLQANVIPKNILHELVVMFF